MGRRSQTQMKRISTLREVVTKVVPYDYLNLGEYLLSLYSEAKRNLGSYSFKEYSADLGIGLGNSSWLIIKGKRSPNNHTLDRMASSLQLSGIGRKAFILLAQYSAETIPANKEQILNQILLCKRQSISDVSAQMELDFYREWYHAIIFEMVGLPNFSSDPSWIVEHVNASIGIREVKESLDFLEKTGIIRFDQGLGRHVKVAADFETKSEVPGVGIIRFHQKMIDLAKESIDTVPYQDREIGAVTVAVSSEGMEVIKKTIQSFRKYLMFLASDYAIDSDTVLQLNFQMFPIAMTGDKKRKDENK
jgi:uncharacterized protein (TIGR02147 family)